MLHYLAKLVKRNDESLLLVRDDLKSLKNADQVILDSLIADIEALKEEIDPIRETVTEQAQQLEEAGELCPMTLKELTEQKTTVRNIEKTPQYNMVDHQTGRTPMERFIINADAQINSAIGFTKSVKEKFCNLLDYFGENQGMASNDFFGILNKFLDEFQRAIDQVNREEKAKVSLCLTLEIQLTTRLPLFTETCGAKESKGGSQKAGKETLEWQAQQRILWKRPCSIDFQPQNKRPG